jgi:hypothetical protein
MPVSDLLLTSAQDFSDWSADPSRPDYASPDHQAMAIYWQLAHDARGATPEIRLKAHIYLPRFEAESVADWNARVMRTFANDHYATTLAEHVGLVFSTPIKLGKDVPNAIKELTEDIDGEGNHLDVFAESTLDAALHLGHAVLYTDYPVTDAVKTRRDAKAAKVRPYATLYPAADVLSCRTAVVGGVQVIAQITFRERSSTPQGDYGTESSVQYREVKQEVFYDEFTGRATRLGAITWRTQRKAVAQPGGAATVFTETGTGTIEGPSRIPARVVYGGEKLGILHTKPHLLGLALSVIEETQVQSDYAAVMHKCNVPTAVFIGRDTSAGATVKMGEGIDIPQGGDAKFLEPTGVALAATRLRLEDIRGQIRRQGATTGDESGKTMTATEAAIYAAQRNAKLAKAGRSLQDAIEGMLADFAAFMGLAKDGPVKSGGSVVVTTNFAGKKMDPQLMKVYVDAYAAKAIPLDVLMYVLEKGAPPEDFASTDTALRLIAESFAASDQLAEDAKTADEPPADETKEAA